MAVKLEDPQPAQTEIHPENSDTRAFSQHVIQLLSAIARLVWFKGVPEGYRSVYMKLCNQPVNQAFQLLALYGLGKCLNFSKFDDSTHVHHWQCFSLASSALLINLFRCR